MEGSAMLCSGKMFFTDQDAYLNSVRLCWKMREEALKRFSQMKADRKLLVSPVSELLGIGIGKNMSLFRWS